MRAKYQFGVEGSAAFIRPVAEAQTEVLESFFDSDEWEFAPEHFSQVPALHMSRIPTALGGLGTLGIIFVFIGTCFAKKIFDEVYDRTLKRPLGAYLDNFFEKAKVPKGKIVEYRDVIYLEDIELVVVIRAFITRASTETLQIQVMQAHRLAHAFIETHGKMAPIHCHRIMDGDISVQPEFFQTLDEIRQHDQAQLKITHRK